jgi:hypothetical protein
LGGAALGVRGWFMGRFIQKKQQKGLDERQFVRDTAFLFNISNLFGISEQIQ